VTVYLSMKPATTLVNSAIHPCRLGKSSTSLPGWSEGGCIHLCWVASNTVIAYSR